MYLHPETTWFWLACGSGGAAACFWASWYFRRRLAGEWRRRACQLALAQERTRIASDFHDDLGSRLAQISMLSESAGRRSNNPPETIADLNRIATVTREFSRSMEQIIWAVDPENDSLDELVVFISGFAQDLLHSVAVRCRLDMPLQLPAWKLPAEARYNIFMAFKEALNNALKHGQPTEVRITVAAWPSGFSITVADNGRGFVQACDAGRGLKNMSNRLRKSGGNFFLESEPGRGTWVSFVVPVVLTDESGECISHQA